MLLINNQAKLTDQLDLKNVILLDNQYTLDLICKKKLTSKLNKLEKKISFQGNGGTRTIKYKARIPGYNCYTWYSKDEIANIISLKNMISRYRVTYDSNDEIFIVHRESSALPYIDFRIYKSVLHVFYPEDINNILLINTVEENMKPFTEHDIE